MLGTLSDSGSLTRDTLDIDIMLPILMDVQQGFHKGKLTNRVLMV